MGTARHVAIDLGAESGRIVLGTLSAGRLAIKEVHRFQNGPVKMLGTLRWNLVRLWEEILAGLRKVGGAVESVSVDSWGVDFVLVRGGEPMVGVAFNYRDPRAAGPYRSLRARVGDAKIYEATGIQFMSINTLYQLVADRERDPQWVESADGFLMIADWFHWLLSGRRVVEETNASTTQLYDPRARAWSRDIIAASGLPARLFDGEIVRPGTRLGPLTGAVAEETGLRGVEVIAGCTHDTAAAVAAVPASGEDWAYLSSGTWSLIGVELAAPLLNEAARRANFTNEIGHGGTIRFLKNLIGLWIVQECRRHWARAGHAWSYDDITRQAAAAPPLRALIRPDDPRFIAPDDMPAKVQAFCRETGQPVPETPGEIVRCALESLALLYRQSLDELEHVTGRTLRVLHIVGGGSRNALLNQFAADATRRTVVAGPEEATAIGNVLVQAIAMQHLDSLAALRSVVRDSFPVESFAPSHDPAWAAALGRFRSLKVEIQAVS